MIVPVGRGTVTVGDRCRTATQHQPNHPLAGTERCCPPSPWHCPPPHSLGESHERVSGCRRSSTSVSLAVTSMTADCSRAWTLRRPPIGESFTGWTSISTVAVAPIVPTNPVLTFGASIPVEIGDQYDPIGVGLHTEMSRNLEVPAWTAANPAPAESSNTIGSSSTPVNATRGAVTSTYATVAGGGVGVGGS